MRYVVVKSRAGKKYKFKHFLNLEVHKEQPINQGLFPWSTNPTDRTIKITDKYGDEFVFYHAIYEVVV